MVRVQSTVQLRRLSCTQRQFFGGVRDTIPDIFDKPNTLGNAETEDIFFYP